MSFLPSVILFLLLGIGSLCLFMAIEHNNKVSKQWQRPILSKPGNTSHSSSSVNEVGSTANS